ncbi:MAG: hypothetical protein M0Q53_18730 [Prolixibacteraceae bacterium]|jgi:hypothetical protein|nr:hypothetical protein [Prolixibacteraceae bacterium]
MYNLPESSKTDIEALAKHVHDFNSSEIGAVKFIGHLLATRKRDFQDSGPVRRWYDKPSNPQ